MIEREFEGERMIKVISLIIHKVTEVIYTTKIKNIF